MRSCILFDRATLLPRAWESEPAGPLWTFNPAILRRPDGWLLAYRVVGADELRRIALCRLNEHFQLVQDSQVPFSDAIVLPAPLEGASYRRWFADPRLYDFDGRVFLYWNTGWHEPQNAQFLSEIDPVSLLPLGPARELRFYGRRPLEKNWSLFLGGNCAAVYSINPHRILTFSLEGTGPIECAESVCLAWDDFGYALRHGELRGGAPPVLVNGRYYSFCHSLHRRGEEIHYSPAVYCFEANTPFRPTKIAFNPLILGNPFGSAVVQPRLNSAVSSVIYPCGAAFYDGHFVISYGINDEHCAISVLPYGDVETRLGEARHFL